MLQSWVWATAKGPSARSISINIYGTEWANKIKKICNTTYSSRVDEEMPTAYSISKCARQVGFAFSIECYLFSKLPPKCVPVCVCVCGEGVAAPALKCIENYCKNIIELPRYTRTHMGIPRSGVCWPFSSAFGQSRLPFDSFFCGQVFEKAQDVLDSIFFFHPTRGRHSNLASAVGCILYGFSISAFCFV